MLKKTNTKKEPVLKLSKIIHLLGEILGLVIKEQEGISFFNKVEKIRILSKDSRDKKNKLKIVRAFRQLKSNISKLNPQESLVIARSFSQFLNISNFLMHHNNFPNVFSQLGASLIQQFYYFFLSYIFYS